MSYDLYVADKAVEEDHLYDECPLGDFSLGDDSERGRYFNYTYNLSEFFTEYGVNPIHDLDGLQASECEDRINKALRRISDVDIQSLEEKYNPDNGWGNVDSAIRWLWCIRDYCRKHPDYLVYERS
ncbi:hypothetical protein [Bifidobacterium callitrichidarum]|uniref:Uncharacterized protein n=1 Tax=Bifidobacterium callitrichidarum TaxID=2052941 RepID=A0A2U2NBU7_9BIFI|nr:hypothetical protein [Bifidobacterium callitrichidarum]PWG66626.1 hypothetical protein DF196_01620 [Bifidobacterium callitrichidarum]